MLSEFTWSEYLIVTAILMAGYYTTVILFANRQRIKEHLRKKSKPQKKAVWKREEITAEEDRFDELEALVEDIRRDILEKAGKQASKAALLERLKERLANYGGLRHPAYRVALNNFIIQKSKEICGVEFSEEELDEQWRTLLH